MSLCRRRWSSARLRSRSSPRKENPPRSLKSMDALKKRMPAKGQTKVRDAVRVQMGKAPAVKKNSLASVGSQLVPLDAQSISVDDHTSFGSAQKALSDKQRKSPLKL